MKSTKKFEEFIENQKWIFAKTYAKFAPHEYIVKWRIPSKYHEIFEEFVEYIRINGYNKKFKSKSFCYYNIDGYIYWTMGNPIDQTIVLNRVKIKEKLLCIE